jgi:subtilase family serine protease
MDKRSVSSPRLAAAASFAAMWCMLGSTAVSAAPRILVRGLASASAQAPTDAFCRANVGIPCYSPQEIRTAYGLNGLIDAGMVGAGQTIVLIESYGSPTIAADLAVFDEGYGLPGPPSLTVLSPLGTVPFDPTNNDMIGWAFETSLDVEWAHALAPGAAIVVLTSPVAETEGVQGLTEFLQLEQYALDHHLGKIISQSWGATEDTLFVGAAGPQGPKVIADYSALYARAVLENVTVLASAGDSGSANVEDDSVTTYPFPTVNFPASSPLVTAVGGTSLYADTSGNYQSETVWNDSVGAGGGGVSQIFNEPLYELLSLPTAVSAQLKGMRGLPDVSYNADPDTSILIYVTFLPAASGENGYWFVGGTSEGAPCWAGIVADLNQYVGRPLGFLNTALYAVGGIGLWSDVGRDITVGNNAFGGVAGYDATPGWDPATGWGTPKLSTLPAAAGSCAQQILFAAGQPPQVQSRTFSASSFDQLVR